MKRNTPSNKQHKDKQKQFYQREIVFKAFLKMPATMLMVAHQTSIERANICRYVAELEKSKSIAVIKKGFCKISKHRAGYYSTNKELLSVLPQQTKLF
jgi:hypothetical protein